jgi:hypothetical protein
MEPAEEGKDTQGEDVLRSWLCANEAGFARHGNATLERDKPRRISSSKRQVRREGRSSFKLQMVARDH